MNEAEAMSQQILEEADRLGRNDKFNFACEKGAPCFTECCGDVNIFLTPYDIIRLKKRLGMTSGEFLKKHTIQPFTKKTKIPVVVLKMNEGEGRKCPFVTADGCTVYEDRPWPCRMYPLGMASPAEGNPEASEDFYFLLKEAHCKGFEYGKDREWVVLKWLDDQGVSEFDDMGKLFKDLSLHDFFLKGGDLDPFKMEMFHMAMYDIDRFRGFVFESSFLKRFDVAAERLDKMKTDDVELMKFAIDWLKFALFAEKSLTVKPEVVEWYEGKAKGTVDIFKKRSFDL